MLANPSLNWQKLQDVYYCNRPCYETLNWSIDNLHSNYKVTISPDTSLIALTSKFVPHPNLVDIYSISGTKLWSVVYNSSPSDHIVDIMFKDENLCVILNNHKFRYYTDFKGNFSEHNYTQDLIALRDARSTAQRDRSPNYKLALITNLENNETEEIFHVLEATTWNKFLILKLKDRFIITDLDSFINYEATFSGLDLDQIHYICPLSYENEVLIILLSYERSVVSFKIDFSSSSYELVDHELTDGSFNQISASPNGSLIALFNSELCKIFVINNSFNQVLLEYDTSNDSSSPYQVEWCGNDAIVLSLRDEIKLVGPGQRSISFFYDIIEEEDVNLDLILKDNNDLSFTIPIIKTEVDGLKIITTNKVEFLSRVPDSCVNLYQIGSSHPCSILLDCVDKVVQHSSKADTSISLLKSDHALLLAMKECLNASLDEFQPYWQKKILKAVSFGNIYNDEFYNAEEYLEVLNYLKVLNQLRSSEIGLFFTYNQLLLVGWERVIEMLLRRDQYYLSLKIIDILGLQNLSDTVYVYWCSNKIKKELNMSDMELFKIIVNKLLDGSSNKSAKNLISIKDISNTAFEEGRIDLCKLLINLEPSIDKRIEYFLQFEEIELALVKSFQSGNYDLCRLILLYLQKELTTSQFFKILNQNEQKGLIKDTSLNEVDDPKILKLVNNENLFVSGDLIGNFWVNSIGKSTPKILERYLLEEDKKVQFDTIKLKEFIKGNDKHSSNDIVDNSQNEAYHEEYKSRLSKFTGRSASKSSAKFFQTELQILELKRRLTETYQKSFYSEKSLLDILRKLIKMNQLKQANKIVKDMKVSQQKFWHLVLQTYAQEGEFTKLYKFITDNSQSTNHLKSPIGFGPIIKTCMFHKAPQDQISIYIESSNDLGYDEKTELYLQNGDISLGANEAFKNKDAELLQRVLIRAEAMNDRISRDKIKSYLNRLGF
ncbi:vacuolar protein sorting-associated protein 16 [Hyphopichia burtonii NRRL Y-1933]|uniref:Probable vacuolar protein sorting-associated protein 16 homolog n=1 Tax=Hyphopichia burtonii NRRL Y-1933 TaxID=984485 RepID=A0A1E4RJX7_9ASCO|nr:vacuolar protein sorting-associated protein 16 [Hyphopichia burtonii NRRL Y-1933]ODV67584.1 vacuolar protein sorting-associated protein 16 [Hyphopichia burtonii NRRL Y-1933]